MSLPMPLTRLSTRRPTGTATSRAANDGRPGGAPELGEGSRGLLVPLGPRSVAEVLDVGAVSRQADAGHGQTLRREPLAHEAHRRGGTAEAVDHQHPPG